MFKKRTRLFINFNLINFFQIIKVLISNKKNFPKYLKDFLKTENIALTSYGRSGLYEIIKIIIKNLNKKIFFISSYTSHELCHQVCRGEVLQIS